MVITLWFCSMQHSFAQNNWALKVDKEGIKVYTKNLTTSPFKAIKTTCIIDASLTTLTAALLDINAGGDWVYATKSCRLLKKISPAEVIYYSEVEIPWPLSNRDFIVLLKVSQDEKTKVVSVDGEGKPSYLPEYKNIVRIQKSYSKWILTPLSNKQVKVEYTLQVDPGGSVPAWIINLFVTKGPYESFKSLRLQVKKPVYTQAQFPFIKN